MRRRHPLVTCLIGVAIFVFAGPARAGAAEEAAAIKATADEAFDGRRFADALEHYEKALEKNRDARLHYNIAQSLAALERYPEALASYQSFIAEAPPGTLNEAQQAQLFALVEGLKAKIARLEIRCNVAGARILVRGKAVGAAPLRAAVVLNSGVAKIEALAEGYRPFAATMTLEGGTARSLPIVLQRIDFSGTIAVKSNVAGAQVFLDGKRAGNAPLEIRAQRGTHVIEVKASEHTSERRTALVEPGKKTRLTVSLERAPNYTLAYVGFGMGAVGVAAGTVTGILALSRFDKAKEQCDQDAKECGPSGQADLRASKTWGTLSTVAFGVGAAGIGLGAYGLATAKPRREPSTSVGLTLEPATLGLAGSF